MPLNMLEVCHVVKALKRPEDLTHALRDLRWATASIKASGLNPERIAGLELAAALLDSVRRVLGMETRA